MHDTFKERINIETNNLSELMFSLHRYYNIANLCINKKVLDVACGTGYGSFIISNNAKSVVGFDIDKNSISLAKEKFKKENLTYMDGNATRMGFDKNSFDVVVSCETIEHLTMQEGNNFLLEIKRVLKKNGLLFMTTPNKSKTDLFSEKNPYHINEFYAEDFINYLKQYFRYVELYFLDLNMVTLMWKNDNTEKAMNNIKLKNWETTKKGIDNPMYMAAICSEKKINKIDLSSVLCDTDKSLNERLWNKLNIYETQISKFEEKAKENLEDI